LGPGGGNVQPSYAFDCAFGQSDATNPAISFPEIMRVMPRQVTGCCVVEHLRNGAYEDRRWARQHTRATVSRGNIVDAMRKQRITQQGPLSPEIGHAAQT